MSEDDQLRQRLESIGRLAGGVAHDFNNLLTSMNGYLHLLSASVEQDSKSARYCGALQDLTERAAYLTQQLHLYTREIPPDSAPVDLGTVAENMSKMLNRIVGERVRIVVETSGDRLRIRGDAIKVSQIMMNLVLNASDVLGADGGTITLAIARESSATGSGVVISAAAAGPDGTAVREIPPVPAIVREITNELGGVVDHGDSTDRGAPLRVILPEFRDAPRETERSPTSILLVENDESILEAVTPGLAASGYRVMQASTLEEASTVLSRDDNSGVVVVVDLVLPDGPGTSLVSELESRSDAAVIMVTGNQDRIPDIKEAVGDRVPVLRKPYTISDLMGIVESVRHRNM